MRFSSNRATVARPKSDPAYVNGVTHGYWADLFGDAKGYYFEVDGGRGEETFRHNCPRLPQRLAKQLAEIAHYALS